MEEFYGPLFLMVFSVLGALGLIWERARHRFNSPGVALRYLEHSLKNNKPDRSSGYIIVRWRRLFPLSREMAAEYAASLGFEYVDADIPPGAMAKYLRFRVAGDSTEGEGVRQ